MRLASAAAALGAAALIAALLAPAAVSARLVNKFDGWSLYAHDGPPAKICFSSIQPKSSDPAGARRDAIYFYVSAWPKDGVKSEVSIKIGYEFKKDSTVTVTVGAAAFKLFTKDDRAFVENPAEELKLIEAMKKSATMVVEGISARGTKTKDTYSLTGLGQALQSLTKACS